MTGSIIRTTMILSMVLVMLAGCATVDKTLRYLTGSMNMQEADLKALYGTGAVFDYSWASGVEGNITFDKSGSAAIRYGEKEDSGSWNIQGDMLCTKWQELGAGEEHCYSVYSKKRGARYRLFNTDGSLHATAVPK